MAEAGDRQPDSSPARILVLGGASEIGLAILAALPLAPGTEVLLAGRAGPRLDAAAWQVKELGGRAWTLPFDATATSSHESLISDAFATAPSAS